MNVAQLISNKRDGNSLREEEIRFLVSGYARNEIPDYQMSAFAMAVYFQGMTLEETVVFTQAMIDSGDRMTWPSTTPPVDKHSTGGIGDKISIPLAPLLACCGVCVPMISGRGLGATGGTLDKLESIPGYRCEISNDEFRSIVNWNACSIASASSTLAPADKRLYALRDVTATVPSIPLITASILSKKVAEGIEALVLDVKWGSGAFMKTLDEARELAKRLVAVGNQLGVKTSALVTDMNQPLGKMIGNAVEIDESIDVLKGTGPEDVTQLTLELGARLLIDAGIENGKQNAKAALENQIQSGAALQRLREMVKSHGGDLDEPRKIATAHNVVALEDGIVQRVSADRLGLAVIELGGGRKKLGDSLDHGTGIEFLVRIGESVVKGQPMARVFSDGSATEYACELVGASVALAPTKAAAPELIVESFE